MTKFPTPWPPGTSWPTTPLHQWKNLKLPKSFTTYEPCVRPHPLVKIKIKKNKIESRKEFFLYLPKPLCSVKKASLQKAKCFFAWKISIQSPIPMPTRLTIVIEMRLSAITQTLPSLICEASVFKWADADIVLHVAFQKPIYTTHCLINLPDFPY